MTRHRLILFAFVLAALVSAGMAVVTGERERARQADAEGGPITIRGDR